LNTNDDTQFPEAIHHTEEPLTYLREDVDDWFKRCIEDIPVIPLDELDYTKEYWRLDDWMMKWFEQFMEED
jgi:hypothetical protein